MQHEYYMQRCIELAKKGNGFVAPNPRVGAVLVHNNTIIGEGWHKQLGKEHAEVNCINSVLNDNKQFIKDSILYVSLEPCSHYGNTPPCTNLIIENNIKTVVIGCKDANEKVDGISTLQKVGINVIFGILEKECIDFNKRFFTFHEKKRPYIILKWAQTNGGFIANDDMSRLMITDDRSNVIVHKWRSEEAAIMIGHNTAILDNPSLTTRNWIGRNPIRVIISNEEKLPTSLNIFNNNASTIIIDKKKPFEICNELYHKNINSVLIEGGTKLLQSFISANLWDEARIITNKSLTQLQGYNAPILNKHEINNYQVFENIEIKYCINKNNNE